MEPVSRLTHLDDAGRASMVDVSDKPDTRREAVARGQVVMQPQTLALILSGGMPKGDVLATARIAGIMAAKRTAELIPLCHPLSLSSVAVELSAAEDGSGIEIEARARTTGPTGVEMEALTAASIAALTLYDMCKAVDRCMRIDAVRVVAKSGGRTLIKENDSSGSKRERASL
jgi:cyclic pyranopterin phosphate synthase